MNPTHVVSSIKTISQDVLLIVFGQYDTSSMHGVHAGMPANDHGFQTLYPNGPAITTETNVDIHPFQALNTYPPSDYHSGRQEFDGQWPSG